MVQDERTSQHGVTMTRFEVRIPIEGAVGARHTVSYVIGLRGGQFLHLETMDDDAPWIARLDALADTVQLTEPLVVSESAIAAAENLFAVRDVCEDPERGLVVTFPEDWWTNTAVDDLPACSSFAPTFFEFESSSSVPDEVEITVDIGDSDYDLISEAVGWETLTLFDRPATRWLRAVGGMMRYEYIVDLDGNPESGPNLVARTVATDDDLGLAMAVLDRLVETISFAQPPPGASSPNPPISAEPISAEAAEGNFHLELLVQQGRYRAGQPIIADLTLTYLGPEPTMTLWGSGMGVIGARLRQIDRTSSMAGRRRPTAGPTRSRAQSRCGGSFPRRAPTTPRIRMPRSTRCYFQDPLLRFPAGDGDHRRHQLHCRRRRFRR